MADLNDLNLRPTAHEDIELRSDHVEPSIGSSAAPVTPADDTLLDEPEPRRPSVWVALAILVALIGGVLYFIYGRHPLPPEQTDTQNAAASAGTAAQPPQEPLPSLDESDELVRTLVKQLSSNPTLLTWIASDNLIRTFTMLVDKIAIGAPPSKQAAFAKPAGAFKVTGSGDDLRIDPASFARYDTLAAVVDSVNAEGAARAFQRLKPLMEQAHRDLGYPAGDFDTKVSLAVARLLETPVPDEPVKVRSSSVNYQFVDPELEGLMASQKQLLRMGPKNQQIVQNKLREFVKAAGLAGR
jgi:hypothetical protein